MLGTQEAIRQSQAKERREKHRARRCNLIVGCVRTSNRSKEINGKKIVLRDSKVTFPNIIGFIERIVIDDYSFY